MSMNDSDLIGRLHAVSEGFEMPPASPADDLWRGRRRVRRNRGLVVGTAAAAAVAVIIGVTAVVGGQGPVEPAPSERPNQIEDPKPIPSTAAPNGWVAIDTPHGDIYLVRPGEDARRLDVAGSDSADDACPTWSPDGTRLMFGRVTGSSDAELVIVPVRPDGSLSAPRVIGLDGFEVLPGFDPHPCGIWAADGRWVALAGGGEVWVVDTETSSTRRLPDLRPSDLEWRPGTVQLTIAGDMGPDRGAPTYATPITVYSVSTGALSQLGSNEAAHITWSPDGSTLAYEGGEERQNAGGLWLVDADGTNLRVLVEERGYANHGIGPVWSPSGEQIAYQRVLDGSGENHEVVLVSVAEGTETVIAPPRAGGFEWYPDTVSWSPDGKALLYQGWASQSWGEDFSSGVIAVPADNPRDARVLVEAGGSDLYGHRWSPTQMWGRQPR